MFEKTNKFHPDKVVDSLSGALVDEAYRLNPDCKIAVEILLGHGVCHIISETSEKLDKNFVYDTVHRICQNDNIYVLYDEYFQDPILASNQKDKVRCGDNGIFKGVPITEEEQRLTDIAKEITDLFPYDGKYVLDNDKLIVCQSHCNSKQLLKTLQGKYPEYNIVVNPLGDWTGGPSVDSGACLEENTLVYTTDGLFRIKDLQIGQEVFTENSSAQISNVISKGLRETKIITDSYGSSIEATADHPFRVFDGKEIIWKNAGDLEIGDILLKRNLQNLNKKEKKIKELKFDIFSPSGNHNLLETKKVRIDQDFAYLIGWLIGDGNYTADDRLNFYCCIEEDKEHLYSLLCSVFGENLIKSYDCQPDRFSILSKGLLKSLVDSGLKVATATGKIIPDFILKSNDAIKGAFISGLFDADGHVDASLSEGRTAKSLRISFSTVSKQLVQEVKVLLHSLGIDSTVSCREPSDKDCFINGKKVVSLNDCFVLHIRGVRSWKRFIQKCNFRLPRKSVVTNSFEFSRFVYDNDTFYLTQPVTELLNLNRTKKLKYFSRHTLLNKRLGYKEQTIEYILDMYAEYKDNKNYKLIKYIYDNFKTVMIEDIKDSNSKVYDITVNDSSHSFIANGFVTHNCNRKLGSDMAQSATGGGINGKDISKADVSVNIYCFLEAQKRNEVVTASCAIGDEKVTFASSSGDTWTLDYQKIVKIAKDYIDSLGGFEKFAEWGLVRPK